jgi:hypothetical protein
MIDLRNLHLIQQKQLTASANKRIMQLTSIHDVLTTLVEKDTYPRMSRASIL